MNPSGQEDHLDLSWLLTEVDAPVDGVLWARKTVGRRRKRRVVAAMTAAGVVAGAVVFGVVSQRRPVGVRVEPVSPNPGIAAVALPAACRGGLPAKSGQARVGQSVTFGWLPTGWTQSPSLSSLKMVHMAKAPAGSSGAATMTLFYESLLSSGLFSASASPIDIEGHAGQLTSQGPGAPTIVWRPESGMVIELEGNRVSTSVLIDIAQHVRYSPGVTAPSVGDLGPVVPKEVVLSAARNATLGGVGGQGEEVVTEQAQLVSASEYGGNSPTGNRTDPLWVVHLNGRFPAGPTLGPGPSVVPYAALVYDAITGDQISAVYGATPPLAGLADHSTRPPCPAPEANSKPATKASVDSRKQQITADFRSNPGGFGLQSVSQMDVKYVSWQSLFGTPIGSDVQQALMMNPSGNPVYVAVAVGTATGGASSGLAVCVYTADTQPPIVQDQLREASIPQWFATLKEASPAS